MNIQQQLLVVDDDAEIRHLLVKTLEKYNYHAQSAKDGKEMFAVLGANKIDLIVLDLMLPGDDGLSICRQIRTNSQVPIIMLTAAGDDADRIVGLEIGADDYISKPFNPRELVARIKAVLRRSNDVTPTVTGADAGKSKNNVVAFSGWKLDIDVRCLISPDDIEIAISSGEYILLLAFIKHPQKVLSRDQLLDFTQNRQAGPFDRSIDVQVSRLRQKIEVNPKNPQLIKTVRGGGYLFTPTVTK